MLIGCLSRRLHTPESVGAIRFRLRKTRGRGSGRCTKSEILDRDREIGPADYDWLAFDCYDRGVDCDGELFPRIYHGPKGRNQGGEVSAEPQCERPRRAAYLGHSGKLGAVLGSS